MTDLGQPGLHNQDHTAWYLHGNELANAGQYVEALESFDRALALQPHDEAAWIFRAVVLLHLDRYALALESCDRALSLSPENAQAWMFRAVALQRLGRYQAAYASYDRAVGRQYRSPRVRITQWLQQRWRSVIALTPSID
jgi:tetratricopeptide (TPR) repeat protein